MLGLVRAGGVAPGVAPALVEVDAEPAADLGVQPLGQALGGLHAEPVDEELLGELAVAPRAASISSVTSGPTVTPCSATTSRSPGVERAVEVGQADPVVARLAREDEPLDLALGVLGVEDDQLVAVGVAGEVAEPRPRAQVVLLAPHPLEPRREALLAVVALDDPPPLLALLAAPAPVQLEEHVAVEVGEDVVEVDRRPRARPRTAARGSGRRCAPPSARESSVTGGASSTTTGFSRSCLRLVADLRRPAPRAPRSSTSASIVSRPWKASLQ